MSSSETKVIALPRRTDAIFFFQKVPGTWFLKRSNHHILKQSVNNKFGFGVFVWLLLFCLFGGHTQKCQSGSTVGKVLTLHTWVQFLVPHTAPWIPPGLIPESSGRYSASVLRGQSLSQRGAMPSLYLRHNCIDFSRVKFSGQHHDFKK